MAIGMWGSATGSILDAIFGDEFKGDMKKSKYFKQKRGTLIYYALQKMIDIYNNEMNARPEEINIKLSHFEKLLDELDEVQEPIKCIDGDDPYCGIIIDEVKIGWKE